METRAEVDRLREVYQHYAASGFGNSKWSSANRGNQAIQGERQLKTRQLLERSGFFPLTDRRILDVGCGGGEQLGLFADWGAKPENLFGVDLLPARIRTAKLNFPRIAFQLGQTLSAHDARPLYLRNKVALTSAERALKNNQVPA